MVLNHGGVNRNYLIPRLDKEQKTVVICDGDLVFCIRGIEW